MNKTIFYTLLAVFMILSLNVLNAEAAEPYEVVTEYFQALKDGNTGVVKSLIADKLYQKKKVLLEKNSSYSTFLQRFYQGANIRIMNSAKKNNGIYVDVEIEFQDGNITPLTLFLKKSFH